MQWSTFFPDLPLTRPFPTFDGRCVCYPKRKVLRDYLSWRQADCHINNLYNTTFWTMVLVGGMTTTEAEQALKGTVSADKNEILFSNFGINYNNEPVINRKGTVVYRSHEQSTTPNGGASFTPSQGKVPDPNSRNQAEKERKRKQKAVITTAHDDIIGNAFWDSRPYILASKRTDEYDE